MFGSRRKRLAERIAAWTRTLAPKRKLPCSTWQPLARESTPGRRKRSELSVSGCLETDKVGAAERPGWQVELIEEVIHLLASALDDRELTAATDLYEIECRVQKLFRRLGAVLTAKLAQRAAAGCPRPCCPGCGQLMQVRNQRGRHLVGTTGEFILHRSEYSCRQCGEAVVPADELWQLGREQLTPALQQVLARAGAEIASFERASELVGLILQMDSLTADSTARTTEALGAVAEQQTQQSIAASEQAREAPDDHDPAALTVLIGVDATKVHAGGCWRDAKIAVAVPLGAEPVPCGKHDRLRLPLGQASYCAGIEGADAFFDRLRVLVRQAGWQPGPQAHLLLIGDGGEWIWNRADHLRQRQTEVTEILDLYHAREHVWEVAHALLGTGVAGHQWGEQLCEAMPAKGGAIVLAALAKLRPRTKAQRELLQKATEYFQTNLARMDYPHYAQQGWPLGSGIVESACRLICGLRCKQPGMRWSVGGAQNVLSLRALALSAAGLWHNFWAGHPQTRRPALASLTIPQARHDAA